MSEGAKVPEASSAPSDASVSRPGDAPVGEVSGAAVDVTDISGVPAAESKEETSVTDIAKDTEEAKAPAETEKPAEGKPKGEADTVTEEPKPETTDEGADAGALTPAPASKSKSRRKSSGAPEHKIKKLNKKQSKAKMSHVDAKPGEYYFIKFKGYPKWPGIIASDDMLPETILKTRPVTAARPDGTYREDFADGGKNVLDRTFPVMFLDTNEFAWIPNTDFEPLDTDTVGGMLQAKMSKSLQAAHTLAAENRDLDYFKDVLREFEENRRAAAEAKEASKAKATAKKGKKVKDVVVDEEEVEEDIEMADADLEKEERPKPSKKRKAVTEDDETATPKRTDSVKKPKLKLISTPKANGAETPKSAKEKKEKAKAKAKKAAAEPVVPKEAEPSPEEKRKIKEKEILFLRHKLQKGLLTRDQRPKEEEMKQMSEFITKLEGYSELEVSIIRATKINKVLKAILKLDEIPKETEFKFKDRSSELLGKWNKILESETPAAAPVQTNGTSSKELVNGEAKAEEETKATEAKPKTEEAASTEAPAAEDDVAMEDAPEKGDTKLQAEESKEETVEEPAKTEAVTDDAASQSGIPTAKR